jgi:S1-C subfamily serine protease
MMKNAAIAASLALALASASFAASAAPGIEDKKLEEITRLVSPSVVKVEARNGVFKVATGVVIDKDGTIVTTALVSPRNEKITVITSEGKRFPAEFKGMDTQTQVALIQVKDKGLAPISLGRSADLKPGAWIGVVGLSPEDTPAVTQGIVSSVAPDRLRLNVWVVPGASGSPVVNAEGKMVGLLRGAYVDDQPVVFEFRERQVVGSGTVISRGETSSAGMALAVPVDIVGSVAGEIKKSGKVLRGWLGVSTSDENGRVEIVQIEAKSPAELAKLKEGDILLKVDGKDVVSSAGLSSAIRARKPGTDVTLQIERDGKPMESKVKLGEYTEDEARRELETLFPRLFPQSEPAPGAPKYRALPPSKTAPAPNLFRYALEKRRYIGVTLQDLTAEQAESFGVKDGTGLWVAELDEDGPAKKAGIKVGDVIVKADGKKVETAAEISELIQGKKKGDKIRIEVVRDKKPLTLDVEIAEDEAAGFFPEAESLAKQFGQEYQKNIDQYRKSIDELRANKGLEKLLNSARTMIRI